MSDNTSRDRSLGLLASVIFGMFSALAFDTGGVGAFPIYLAVVAVGAFGYAVWP